MDKWAENLTDEQETLTQIIIGHAENIRLLFDLLGKDMEKEHLTTSKMGLIYTLTVMLGLKMDDSNDGI